MIRRIKHHGKRVVKAALRWSLVAFGLWLVVLAFTAGWTGVQVYLAVSAAQRGELVTAAKDIGRLSISAQLAKVLSFGLCSDFCQETESLTLVSGRLAEAAVAGQRSFYFWFQNDMELRPTGGFLGSYARLDLSEGKLASLLVQDIYVPDGQVEGYVKPPYALEKYLSLAAGWKLRDANWDPDFPASVQSVQWFFKEAKQPDADGVIAVNFGFVEDLWKLMGTIHVPDYGSFEANSLYPFLQAEVEHNFFPGSTKKTDVLSALSKAFFRTLQTASWQKKIEFALRVLDGLPRKDVQLWFADAAVQKEVARAKWGGYVSGVYSKDSQDVVDYLNLNEANVGGNKSNCCMQREVEYNVQFQPDGRAVSSLILQYRNNNPVQPDPPNHYGGVYLALLRVFRQPDWKLLSGESDLPADPVTKLAVKDHSNLGVKEFSGMLKIPGTQEKYYQWNFERTVGFEFDRPWTYTLRLQNQSGSRTPRVRVSVIFPPGYEIAQATEPGVTTENVWTASIILDRDRDIILHVIPK